MRDNRINIRDLISGLYQAFWVKERRLFVAASINSEK